VASASCADALRRGGADGSVLLIGREPDLPYDRPPCSKGYLRGSVGRDDVLLHPPGWYDERDVEVLTRTTVLKLDLDRRVARLSNREEVRFGQALIATGANVRRLNVPGAELDGIHYLRTLGNADAIRADAPGKRVVLVGGSYLGSELAASLTELGCECTVMMIEALPLSRGFGDQAGRFFLQVLEAHGVAVHGGHELERFEGRDGRVTRVVASGGLELEADAVVVCAGAVPDVTLARAAGLELGESGGVSVDRCLRTAAPGVYAAGDIAEYESVVHGARRMRIEHWDVAFSQGRTVARNILGQERAHDAVPYFFSDISDWASLEYVGPAFAWDREIVRGSPEEGSFAIFYVAEQRVVAALAVGRSEDLVAARRLIVSGERLGERAARLGDLDSDLDEL